MCAAAIGAGLPKVLIIKGTSTSAFANVAAAGLLGKPVLPQEIKPSETGAKSNQVACR